MDIDPTDQNRQEYEYTRYMSIQESILLQKANIQWRDEGDSCSKYFFSVIKYKRRRNLIHMMQDSTENLIENGNDIGETSIQYFKHLFTKDDHNTDFAVLNQIDKVFTERDNNLLTRIPE